MQSLIYLVRHGEIDRPTPRRFLGQTDLPLNENGVLQAMALRDALAAVDFSQVFTSPLQRAVQTAALVSGRPIESLHRVEAFKEIDLGDWEGLSVAEVEARFPGAYAQRGRDLAHFRPQGGESFADLADRCWPALADLASRFAGPLLIVAHAGVNRAILARVGNHPLQRLLEIPQDYCCVTRLRADSHGWDAETINFPGLAAPQAAQINLSSRTQRP
jgi:probable phosphoglycerate mutase